MHSFFFLQEKLHLVASLDAAVHIKSEIKQWLHIASRHSKTPNAATCSTLLYMISPPRVHLVIRPVTPPSPPFHLLHRRSRSRSRNGRRSRSRERDRSRRRGHDREREKERDRGRGRDNEGDSKEKADKKRWIGFWHMITHAQVDTNAQNVVRVELNLNYRESDFRLHLACFRCPSITRSFYPSVHHYLFPLFPHAVKQEEPLSS